MSVYYEAFKTGRLTTSDCSPLYRGERVRNKGIARALRAVKRAEAEERNRHTPTRRTKAYRRELGLLPPLKEATRRG